MTKTNYASRRRAFARMAISVRSITALTILAVIFLAASAASVEAQISITTLNTPYSQNFDGMGTSDFGLTDDVTGSLLGFHAYREFGNTSPNFVGSDDGSGTNGGFKNYGLSSQFDRAFGMLPDGTTGFTRFGARFVNNTGSPISTIEVTFTGEQWRNGGSGAPQTLVFAYRKDVSVNDLVSGVYTVVPSLSFTSPVTSPFASDLNGNDPANRATLTATLPVVVMPGEEIMLRWEMTDEFGEDHGLSVDDLTVTPFGGSTAAAANIDGRVIDASGRGIPRTRVMLIGGNLTEPQFATTNAFGYYRFEDLESGEAYLLRVESKKHRFVNPVLFVNLGDNMADVNFVAAP